MTMKVFACRRIGSYSGGLAVVAEQIIKDNGYLTKNNLQELFNEVINQAEERGYLEMTDVRKLANSGIPLLSFCTDRSVFFDAIRYRFEKWLNSL